MPIKKVINEGMPVKIWTDDIEESAMQQLRNISKMPFIHKHVAAMPDVHWGMGATIGSVIPSKGAIIPAAVGVDLGCGMMACRLDLTASELPDNLYRIRSEIEASIPHGRTDNGGRNDKGAWSDLPVGVASWWLTNGLPVAIPDVVQRHPDLLKGNVNGARHLGTLGTGNHFIEICLDEQDRVWLMLHSGSRGIGNRVGSYFIELAKKDMERWFISLPDKDLAYFPDGTEHFRDYVAAVGWAQDFARENRVVMMGCVLSAVRRCLDRPLIAVMDKAVNCHHNYVERENHFGANVWITRKGAIRAREGDLGIIPGSMGTGSFIVRGKGNPESFHSCSHGAGRKMGRAEAKRRFTVEDLAQQTAGIECRKDADVIDEIPGAYKPIGEVMENQSDLVEIVHTLRQVVNVKG
jgi:tRNA-splicing ligase RtcB